MIISLNKFALTFPLRFGTMLWLFTCVPAATAESAAEPIEFTPKAGEWIGQMIPGVEAGAECFSVEVTVDPVVAEGGDVQVVAGLGIGLPDEKGDRTQSILMVDLREGHGRASYVLWHRKRSMTLDQPDPKPAGWRDNGEYQHPNEMTLREETGYRVRLVVWPDGEGSRVRVFIDEMDRPKEEHFLAERVTAGVVKLFATRGGTDSEPSQVSRFSAFAFKSLTIEQAQKLPQPWESVLRSIDYSYPPMAPVADAIRKGNLEFARTLFLRHMRSRRNPAGPTLEEAEAFALHPDWQLIADEAVGGRYGTTGYFADMAPDWTDTNGDTHRWVLQENPLQVNWARCNGHLNRHFHWVSLAKAWEKDPQAKYAQRFGDEVLDWVTREPFYWERCPTIGGLNLMDGTTFRRGFMNTSNIGRRLELTWWPAYEVFRKSPDFSDEAHFAMLLGMLRQARLITNPSSFAAHDDGGAHTTMALLQTALLLPEFAESAAWKATAMERWEVMLAAQFHPDGSHASLSTGYNWASITALENYLLLFQRFGGTLPGKYLNILERAVEHTMLLTTPTQGNIDLNDGGWGLFDDRFQSASKWFPQRPDFEWMATRGVKGSPPQETSLYFPNAGQYVMRTGWGPGEKYLFFGAGPWGASHGKFDALNIYAQFGNTLLVRNAGRGSYSGVGNTKHAGRSLSFNTLSPDWAQENSIPHWKEEMRRGLTPPERRWISNEDFDYGEGSYEYGWHRPGEHIQGKWVRQVIFAKGGNPKIDGYFIVIDTVEPADNQERTWRHPWQLGFNPPEIAINEENRSVTGISPAVALQILPVDPAGDLRLEIIEGQEDPELLGWRVHDTTANPFPVPTYAWKASGTFSRAWILQMQAGESEWPVQSVETHPGESTGELRFTIVRRDGGKDHVLRRFPGQLPVEFRSETIEGDLAVFCTDAKGVMRTRLEITKGEDSVARPSLPASAEPGKAGTADQ